MECRHIQQDSEYLYRPRYQQAEKAIPVWFAVKNGGNTVTLLFFVLFIIIVIQNFYIRYLKKEICLRDGTYQPKESKLKRLLLKWFQRRKDES